MIDIRQSKNWGKYLEGLGWKNKYLDVDGGIIAIRIRQLSIFGSVIKIQRPQILSEKILKEIGKTVKKYRPLIIKIEPDKNYEGSLLEKFGYKKDFWPLSTPKTIRINLEKSEKEQLKSFSRDTRYSIRKAKGNNLDIIIDNKNIEVFYHLLKRTSKRGKFYAPKLKDLTLKTDVFGEKAKLILAYKDGIAVAGSLMLFHDSVAYYIHAASTKKGQKSFAPYLVLWNVIKISKSEGCKTLDLEGIYDERFKKMTKNWKSFTIFKSKWGGSIVDYHGSYIKFQNLLLRIIFGFERLLP